MSAGTQAVCCLCGDEFELPEYYTLDAERFACERCGGVAGIEFIESADERSDKNDD